MKRSNKPEPMQPVQALTLAILALEWEAESAAQNVRAWRNECSEAAQLLRRVRIACRPARIAARFGVKSAGEL